MVQVLFFVVYGCWCFHLEFGQFLANIDFFRKNCCNKKKEERMEETVIICQNS